MDLMPAIDLLGGRVVQLVQGDYDSGTVHGDDPVAVARAFEAAGCPWIHCVDLDAARTGDPVNRALIARVVDAVGVPVQVGGGVRSEESARELAALGVHRVVIGTAALDDPAMVARVAARQRVAIGLDVRGREVAVKGWTEGSGVDWDDALDRLADAGAEAVVVTQIQKEGLMAGPDVEGLREVLAATALEVVASGGVSDLDDLRALGALRTPDGRALAGVIVGTAIYEGRIPVRDAVEVLGCTPHG
jgi:phosphoribosylformimino-5-aminoimidazole carboxamide ribotide isomerase